MTSTELGYLSGVTSNIQTQLDGKAGFIHSELVVTGGGWKQILSWTRPGSFIVSIWNFYNNQTINSIALLVNTGHYTAQIRLLNTANRSDLESNTHIRNVGICYIDNKFTLNILLSEGFNNGICIDVLPLADYIDPVFDYDDSPSINDGYIEFLHNFVGEYMAVKIECAVYGDTLPSTNTNTYESSWYKGHIFFLKSG